MFSDDLVIAVLCFLLKSTKKRVFLGGFFLGGVVLLCVFDCIHDI